MNNCTVTMNFEYDYEMNQYFKEKISGQSAVNIILSFDEYLRKRIKYDDHDEKTDDLLREVREMLHEIKSQYEWYE